MLYKNPSLVLRLLDPNVDPVGLSNTKNIDDKCDEWVAGVFSFSHSLI